MMTYQPRLILVPLDFSDPSRAALDVASSLAKSLGASIHLLHAYRPPEQPLTVGLPLLPQEMLTDIEAELRSDIDKLTSPLTAAGLAVTTSVMEGSPGHEIVRAASEQRADMIVMGTHGRTGLKHAIMGSVAEHVVRHATCPVLVVPARFQPASA